MLEDETLSTTHQSNLFSRVLPDLSKNIVCGNSLIGSDIYSSELFSLEEEKKLNPINYTTVFPLVMRAGGFDAIVGNPPYVRQETLGEQKEYFQSKYKVYHGMADLYTYFIEKGISLLKRNGLFSVIVGNKWMRAKYGEPLRVWLKKQNIKRLVDFGDLAVFKGATTYTCIPVVSPGNENSKPEENLILVTSVSTLDFQNLEEYVNTNVSTLSTSSLDDTGWVLSSEQGRSLFKSLLHKGVKLNEYVNGKIYRGVVTGFNEAFVVDLETRNRLIKEDSMSEDLIKPYLAGKDIKRYQEPRSDKYLIFSRRGTIIDNYPAIKNHLQQFKTSLTPKPKDWKGDEWKGRKPGHYKWFEIQDTVDYWEAFEKNKILWPGISAEVTSFALDKNKYYGNDNNQLIESDDLYLLGVLNSKLSKYVLKQICDKVQGGFYRLKIVYIEQLPIKLIQSQKEKQIETQIVSLVAKIIEVKKAVDRATTEGDKEFLQSKSMNLDHQINTLVYELYDLSEEEILIIESN